jgi:hypothetical protein
MVSMPVQWQQGMANATLAIRPCNGEDASAATMRRQRRDSEDVSTTWEEVSSATLAKTPKLCGRQHGCIGGKDACVTVVTMLAILTAMTPMLRQRRQCDDGNNAWTNVGNDLKMPAQRWQYTSATTGMMHMRWLRQQHDSGNNAITMTAIPPAQG